MAHVWKLEDTFENEVYLPDVGLGSNLCHQALIGVIGLSPTVPLAGHPGNNCPKCVVQRKLVSYRRFCDLNSVTFVQYVLERA